MSLREEAMALLLAALLATLVACGGGGGGGGSRTTPTPNTVTVVSNLGVNGNYADGLFTSVTVCVPGTSNCQTIDNVLVDTGSFGLRLLGSQVNLPLATSRDSNGDPLGECQQFASSFNWGPVATADVVMAGEKASAVPIQLMGQSGFPAPPAACSSSGLAENDTQATLGANGILGVGVFGHDCGAGCAPGATSTPSVYFGCPSSGCVATLVALADQVQNPVGLFPQDNNGVVIQMPQVPDMGALTVSGTLRFGIDTQADNAMSGVNVLAADGFGNFLTTFQGKTFSGSILDSGSNGNFFLDTTALSIPLCGANASGFYCPASTVSFSATNMSAAGAGSAPAVWNVANAETLFNSGNAAFNNLAGPNSGSFDFGMAFFFARTIYVGFNGAIIGSGAGSATGPFYAY